ncbi:FtsX-like permease family protein [Anaerococcus sp. AGMB00486]|uniref:FtsX-like permease family protein n=2 Tax=Anaerococcus TaxID=165779 RepID=A0ABX2NA36_9FIRM|nr:FtsX-like permease family protein [Anaerococcus porci]MDY3006723.1 FtsX-like permease family protein [Anaerococcus porci]MSS77710.1 FtsX-like permease family protein [Anaerococcus porci]NVF11566.1 FtsX-like permease family protein [Anaerococcus faecalis]
MNKLNFTLAKRQISTNKYLYLPYIIASSLMLFIFNLIVDLKTEDFILNSRGGAFIESILGYGQFVIALFAVLFLIYMTNAVVKSRYKELGLLYGLGMDKGSLRGILFIQNIILALLSLLSGTFLSLLLSPLIINLVGRLLGYGKINLNFNIDAIKLGFIVFSLIFILITIISLNSIRKKNPLELSQMAKKGQAQPKFSMISFILSIIFLALSYKIALSIDGALDAIPKFFPAIILAIFGTFLFFRSVTIWILKLLRKNKRIYYKSTNMTFIGELIKRSKESAMALSSISIIASMLLMSFIVMVAMFIGKNSLLDRISPRDFVISYQSEDLKDNIDKLINLEKSDFNIKEKNEGIADISLLTTNEIEDEKLKLVEDDEFKNIMMDKSITIVSLTDIDSFNKANNTKESLNDGEALVYDSKNKTYQSLSIDGVDLNVSKNLREIDYILTDTTATLFHNLLVVVKDKSDFLKKLEEKGPGYDFGERSIHLKYFDVEEKDVQKMDEFSKIMIDHISKNQNLKGKVEFKNAYEARLEFDQIHQGAYITVILLSFMFFVSAIVVIYYKQVAEGIDDGRSIGILKKIGMSNSEIRKSVAKQNYVTFFAPLVLAIIHILVASKLAFGILQLFTVLDKSLFIKIEVLCILIFAIIYFLIFRITLPIYFEIGKLNKE